MNNQNPNFKTLAIISFAMHVSTLIIPYAIIGLGLQIIFGPFVGKMMNH